MGQGTESCGGYDIEYDPYEEDLADGYWHMKNGRRIHITKMASSHIRNARRLAERAAVCANFSCEEDKWNAWVEAFDDELASRTNR